MFHVGYVLTHNNCHINNSICMQSHSYGVISRMQSYTLCTTVSERFVVGVITLVRVLCIPAVKYLYLLMSLLCAFTVYVCGNSLRHVCYIFRSELDHICSPDMCTEEFSATLDLIVSPKDRPNAATSCPWHGYSSKGVSPKLLFMKKEELLAVTAEFGKCQWLHCDTVKQIIFHNEISALN